MGIVYEAYDTALGRRIALKTISAELAASAEEKGAFEKRFLAEARIAAGLAHPGIVTVHDVGRDDESGTLFIALEYIEGRTLAQVLKDGPQLAWRGALGIVRAVAEALHHAHSRGVIHRDVKPGNVMMLPGGQPKIMDFGIARVETSMLTAAGEILGTPLYMSPEQARGERVDARADLFSLGAIAYALLTGQAAFAAENTLAVLMRVLSEDPARPSMVVPGLPAAVDALVARALAKNPADRYPDGQALAEDVEDILAGRRPRHLGDVAAEEALPEIEGVLEPVVEGTHVAAPPPPAHRAAARVASETKVPDPPWARVKWRELALIAVVVLGALAVAYAILQGRPGAGIPASGQPGSSEPSAPASSGPAQLVVDFEHPVRTGMLRVWLDDQPVIEQEVDSRVTKDIGGLKLRKGRLEKTLEMEPGLHSVRVQFSWEGNVKSERTSATLASGLTRLEARIGRLRKNLSLEWR